MQAFEYAQPETVADAVALLARHPGSRPLAGGTDLITQLKEGRRQASLVVDLKRIPDLNILTYAEGEGLRIGAATPCVRLQESDAVRRNFPVLAYVSSLIGSYQIQNRASLGGNLCNASPSADSIPALIVLGARARVVGPAGERWVDVDSVVTAPGRTVLEPGEILVELAVPPRAPNSGAAYQRFIPRGEMDIAVVGVGASLTLGMNGQILAARLALAAVAPTPLRVPQAEEALLGREACEEAFGEAARIASEACSPISDVRGSAEYRRHLVGVLTRRVLAAAYDLAKGGQK